MEIYGHGTVIAGVFQATDEVPGKDPEAHDGLVLCEHIGTGGFCGGTGGNVDGAAGHSETQHDDAFGALQVGVGSRDDSVAFGDAREIRFEDGIRLVVGDEFHVAFVDVLQCGNQGIYACGGRNAEQIAFAGGHFSAESLSQRCGVHGARGIGGEVPGGFLEWCIGEQGHGVELLAGDRQGFLQFGFREFKELSGCVAVVFKVSDRIVAGLEEDGCDCVVKAVFVGSWI